MLPVALAPDGHVRHAGHALQARHDRPAGQDGHLDRRERLGGKPDDHHPARRRAGLEHDGGLGDVRQRVCLAHALGDQLARLHQIGAGLEDDDDGRQPGEGLGADALDPGHSVEEVLLHPEGDQLLDFLRGKSERLGLDLHVRQRELRQDVQRHVAEPCDTHHEKRDGQYEDDESRLETRLNDRAQHG